MGFEVVREGDKVRRLAKAVVHGPCEHAATAWCLNLKGTLSLDSDFELTKWDGLSSEACR